ncbi:MAG: response regulator, partial [Burkholderiales bacterium]
MPHLPVVLVVEDEFLTRVTIVGHLEDIGCVVIEAENADAANRILAQNDQINVVFTDVDMPGAIDGLQLAEVICAKWPAIRIVVTSGKSIVEVGDIPVGARFFSKPYNLGE